MAKSTVTGTDRLIAALQKAGVAARKELGAALYVEGEAIMAKSKPITPIEFGPLRASGHVTLPEDAGQRVVVSLGFGGPSAPYAVYVHERLELRHKPPTQAKYLEQPFREAQTGMEGRLATRIEKRIEAAASR